MNVEQLIEDGWKEYLKWATCETASNADMGSFEFGVRHALAALFPVVWVEDLKEGCFYLGLRNDTEEWEPVKCVLDGSNYLLRCGEDDVYQSYDTFIGPLSSDFDWIDFHRRCPTPGDVGMGGV